MNRFAFITGATVTVTGPGIVTGLMNSGGDVPESMIVAVSTVCGGGVGVGVGVDVGVGVAVGVGVGVGVPAFTITIPRRLLLPSCVKLWIRRKCLSGTTIVKVGPVSGMTTLLKSPAIRREVATHRQVIKNDPTCLLMSVLRCKPMFLRAT